MSKVIDCFKGVWGVFSNPYPTAVLYEDILFPSSEHAYIAGKSTDMDFRRSLVDLPWQEAKRRGRATKLRAGWEAGLKLKVMEEVNLIKYTTNQFCYDKLMSTRGYELIEGNWWGDRYWGVCDGVGENHLGRILMKIRHQLDAGDNYVEF